MYTSDKLVRFDWAIKRLLRNKADYCIVEGLLTALLGKKIFIKSFNHELFIFTSLNIVFVEYAI